MVLQLTNIIQKTTYNEQFDLIITMPICSSKIYDSILSLANKHRLKQDAKKDIKQEINSEIPPELEQDVSVGERLMNNCSVLVAEDNRINQTIVKVMLTNARLQCGYRRKWSTCR